MAEWLIAPILKIGVALRPPRVRILLFPKKITKKRRLFYTTIYKVNRDYTNTVRPNRQVRFG
jgi:hypothetical protein